jgi:hypothetical protein
MTFPCQGRNLSSFYKISNYTITYNLIILTTERKNMLWYYTSWIFNTRFKCLPKQICDHYADCELSVKLYIWYHYIMKDHTQVSKLHSVIYLWKYTRMRRQARLHAHLDKGKIVCYRAVVALDNLDIAWLIVA